MKRRLRDLFLALKQSSKLTIISVLCILTSIILFLISAAIASHATGYLHSMMMLAFSGSLALLSLSFLGFAFLTGYNREFALFYVLAIPVSILFLSLSAASIVSYMKAYDSFDFFVLGLYFCINI